MPLSPPNPCSQREDHKAPTCDTNNQQRQFQNLNRLGLMETRIIRFRPAGCWWFRQHESCCRTRQAGLLGQERWLSSLLVGRQDLGRYTSLVGDREPVCTGPPTHLTKVPARTSALTAPA